MAFQIGEIAIYVGRCSSTQGFESTEVTICAPPSSGLELVLFERMCRKYCDQAVYCIVFSDGELGRCPESDLRKRPSDDDQLFTRWFRDHIITEPLVETMTRTMRNLETFTTGDANGR